MFKKTWVVVGVVISGGLLLTCFQNCGGGMQAVDAVGTTASASSSPTGDTDTDDTDLPTAPTNAEILDFIARIQAQATSILANANINITTVTAGISSLSGLVGQLQNIDMTGMPASTVLARDTLVTNLQTGITLLQNNLATLTTNGNVLSLLTQIQSQAVSIMNTIQSGQSPSFTQIAGATASMAALLKQLRDINLSGLPAETIAKKNEIIAQLEHYASVLAGMFF